jgi:hypothetical protein
MEPRWEYGQGERAKTRTVSGAESRVGGLGTCFGRTSGGTGGPERSEPPGLIEVPGTAGSMVGNGFRLSRVELPYLLDGFLRRTVATPRGRLSRR